MKRSFLEKLQRTALLTLIGALFLLLLVPLLQLLVLDPQGYGNAPASSQAGLVWIQGHTVLFLLYRLALLVGFSLLLGLPFALFRIIVAQEIIGRAEIEAEEREYDESEEEEAEIEANEDRNDETEEDQSANQSEQNELPPFAWRGKGFAVIAAWAGLPGLILLATGTLSSTIYLWSSAQAATTQTLPDNFSNVSSLLALLTYTIGGGLVAIAGLFFGIVIVRSGRKLWPPSWVAFGYTGTAAGAVASGSAVQVALVPIGGQAGLTTPAILLFALWSLWFGIMVVRLRPE